MRWHLAEFGTEEEKLLKENTIGKIDAFLEKFTVQLQTERQIANLVRGKPAIHK